MAARETAGEFVRLLEHVRGGTLRVTIDGAPFATLDGERRDLTVEVQALLQKGGRGTSLLRESHLRLWEVRGVPSALARAGWNVSLRDGADEVVRLGRDASALTGHVHLGPRALWKLGRVL